MPRSPPVASGAKMAVKMSGTCDTCVRDCVTSAVRLLWNTGVMQDKM